MISGVGLEVVTETICANTTLISLDVRSCNKNQLGVIEGSTRKNSIGLKGAMCILNILSNNNTLVKFIT